MRGFTGATRRVEFDAAHRLPDHKGKCRRLHGHRYVVDVTVVGPLETHGSSTGMVFDFGDLDAVLADVIGRWDHRTLLCREDPLTAILLAEDPDSIIVTDWPPTAENLAEHIAGRLVGNLGPSIAVTEVRVQETPRGWAAWTAR